MHSDLTQGKIFGTLWRLALPLAGGQVMQMAYNLTDMFWLGRVSSEALAATGAAGLFIWLSVGLMMVGRVGAEIGVSQAHGRGDLAEAYKYSRTALYISGVLGVLYGAFLFLLRVQLIGFFNFREAHVAADAITYAGIIALSFPAMYMSGAVSGSFVASGNSRTPFLINSSGLILNMILTPIVIFPLGMGVFGAAISSVISKYAALFIFLFAIKRFKNRPFEQFRLLPKIRPRLLFEDLRGGVANKIFRMTLPICLEQTLWPLLTLIITRIEVSFGAQALAISRVGVQIESLSWLVGAGFGAALTAFVGQNYGAGRHDRIASSVRYATITMLMWGTFVTAFMWFGGGVVFRIFFPEYGWNIAMHSLFITHMRIIAASQIFANLEYVAANAFRGKGRTIPPSVAGISTNVIRVPLAFFLSRTSLGVLGVWAAISFTYGLHGLSVAIWYLWDKRKNKEEPVLASEA